MSFLDDLKNETTIGKTENGAKTYTSSLNKNLDLYAQAGAIRNRMDDADSLFSMAYAENKELALKNMSYLRDIRQGLGEREAFRIMMNKLVETDSNVAIKFLPYISHLGRWDDLVEAYFHAKKFGQKDVAEEAIRIMAGQLAIDVNAMINGEKVSLAGKWLPSPSVKNKRRKQQANMIAHDLGFTVRDYRKLLVMIRKYIEIVETKLSEKDYYSIDFEKLPSRALFKYRQAFQRHMESEYENFIDRVNDGEVKMNASNVLPYEIIKNYISYQGWGGTEIAEYDKVLEATWKSLDDVIGEAKENAIVVADTSASMHGDPSNVAESLAIYCAERLQGVFHNHFITFSREPQLVELPDNGTLREKMVEYSKYSIVEDTNIEKVFKLILNTAIKNKTKQEDLPKKIIIVSDMEFNQSTISSDETIFDVMKLMYERAGYSIPNVVFWNVDSRQDNLPVRHNEQGVALVSGLTPNIFKQVLLNDFVSPEQVMLDTLNQERYDFVEEILK